MANPSSHVVLGEEEAQQVTERYAKMEAELQALRQRNEELVRIVQEQQDLVAAERVKVDRHSRAQTQEFANLTVELLAGRQGPDVQLDRMRIGVKVENLRHIAERKLMTWIRGCSKFTSIWISQPSQREATSRTRHPCSAGTLRSGGMRLVKDIVDQLRGMIFVGCCENSFGQKTTEDADTTS